MRRPRAAPLVLRRNALTRRPPFYALVVLLFMAVFRNLDLPKLTGKHAEAVSEAIKMRRRNTIQRDAMHAQVRNRRPRYRVDGVPGLPVQGMPRSNALGRYRTKSTPSTQVKDEHIEHHVHA